MTRTVRHRVDVSRQTSIRTYGHFRITASPQPDVFGPRERTHRKAPGQNPEPVTVLATVPWLIYGNGDQWPLFIAPSLAAVVE